MERRSHPVLQKHAIEVSYNTLTDCYEAAKEFGSEYFWNAPVGEKEMMIGFIKGKSVISAIVSYEEAELAKKEAKKKAKQKKYG